MIRVRKAGKRDTEQILCLWRNLVEFHENLPGPVVVKRYWKLSDCAEKVFRMHLSHALKSKNYMLLVAADGSKIVGYAEAWIKKRWRGFSFRKEVYVEDLAVSEKYRSRGIGSKLIREIEKRAKTLKIRFINLDADVNNSKALKFYKKQGFEKYNFQLVKEVR